MKGVKAGETREGQAKLTNDAPNEALRGKTVTAVFEVLEVKKLELPELTPELLHEMGFESEAELRDAIQEDLKRQLEYHQQQETRRQITATLTESANWQLPPELLRRQSRRELERAVLELRRNGFSDAEIQAHENELRQNSAASTARALKEHFILERIAEDQKHRGRARRLRTGNRADRRAKRRERAPRAGPAGKGRPDGRPAKSDHRAQGDRPGAFARSIQGCALQARGLGNRSHRSNSGRRGRGIDDSRSQAPGRSRAAAASGEGTRNQHWLEGTDAADSARFAGGHARFGRPAWRAA